MELLVSAAMKWHYFSVILLLGLSWLVGVGDTNNCDCQRKAVVGLSDCSRSIGVIREHKARQSGGTMSQELERAGTSQTC